MSFRRGGVALGAIALVAAIASGSRALGVVGVGFLLAGGVTWLWAWLVDGPVHVVHKVDPSPAVEGDAVRVAIGVRRRSRVPLGSMTVRLTVGRLGACSCRMRGHGRLAKGGINLGPLPRGVFALPIRESSSAISSASSAVTPRVECESATVVVRPRLTALDGLFSDAGRAARGRTPGAVASGRRLRLPLRARVRAGRVAPARALADERATRAAHGEGARGHRPRRRGRDPRLRPAVRRRRPAGLELRRGCAGCGLAAAGPRRARARSHARLDRTDARGGSRALGGGGSRRGRELARSGGAGRRRRSRTVPRRRAFVGRRAASWRSSRRQPMRARSPRCSRSPSRRLVSVVWIDAASFASRPTRAEPGLLRLAAHGIPTGGGQAWRRSRSRALGAVVRGGGSCVERSSHRCFRHSRSRRHG